MVAAAPVAGATEEASAPARREGLPQRWRRKAQAEDWRKQELEKRNGKKYHQLKFIEKVKIERKLRTCRRLLLGAVEAGRSEDVASLKEQLRAHLADHEYIEFYPKHLPYNALFPKQDSEASQRRREEMRKFIREERAKAGEGAASSNETLGASEASASGASVGKRRGDAATGAAPGTAPQAKKAAGRAARRASKKASREADEDARAPAVDDGDVPVKKGRKRGKKAEAKDLDRAATGGEASAAGSGKGPLKKGRKRRQEGDATAVDGSGKGGGEDSARADEKRPLKKGKRRRQEGDSVGALGSAKNDEEVMHPSWQARKSAKVSGSLVGSAASSRKVFESDSEG